MRRGHHAPDGNTAHQGAGQKDAEEVADHEQDQRLVLLEQRIDARILEIRKETRKVVTDATSSLKDDIIKVSVCDRGTRDGGEETRTQRGLIGFVRDARCIAYCEVMSLLGFRVMRGGNKCARLDIHASQVVACRKGGGAHNRDGRCPHPDDSLPSDGLSCCAGYQRDGVRSIRTCRRGRSCFSPHQPER